MGAEAKAGEVKVVERGHPLSLLVFSLPTPPPPPPPPTHHGLPRHHGRRGRGRRPGLLAGRRAGGEGGGASSWEGERSRAGAPLLSTVKAEVHGVRLWGREARAWGGGGGGGGGGTGGGARAVCGRGLTNSRPPSPSPPPFQFSDDEGDTTPEQLADGVDPQVRGERGEGESFGHALVSLASPDETPSPPPPLPRASRGTACSCRASTTG